MNTVHRQDLIKEVKQVYQVCQVQLDLQDLPGTKDMLVQEANQVKMTLRN